MKKRESLVTEVSNHLTDLIITDYAPGKKIPTESELAEKFSVSRTTIREAIKLLCARNILEIRRGDGTYVSERPGISEDPLGLQFIDHSTTLKDLQEFSLLAHPIFASLATSRANESDISNLKQIHEQFEKKYSLYCTNSMTVDSENIKELRSLDNRFHQAILNACHNEIIDRIDLILEPSIDNEPANIQKHVVESSFRFHNIILKAIVTRNPFAAHQSMMMHISYNNTLEMNLDNLFGAPL